MKKQIFRWSIVLGILIFAFIVYRVGPDQIWTNIKKISLENFLILVALRIMYWLLRTINWKNILDKYQDKTSLLQLFKARMCGHAVSQLTPTAQLGSETTRILMADCASKKIGFASAIVDKTIEFFTVVIFTFIGVIILFFRIPLPMKLKTIFLGGVIFAALMVSFFFLKQRKGLLTWIIDTIAKIKIRFKILDKNRDKIQETDQHISSFYQQHGKTFMVTFLLYSLLILLWAVEIHLGLLYLGVKDLSIVDSFLITVLGNLAFLFPFIPGSIGIYEATYIGLFALLGKSADVALSLVLIRRIIALLLAGFGLLGILKSKRN